MSIKKIYQWLMAFLFTLILACSLNMVKAVTVDIRDFGAIGDGKIINTESIQKSIDVCSQFGGGTVVFPKGIWLTGSILIKSGVVLDLHKEATLLGSNNLDDYKIYDSFTNGVGHKVGYSLISAVDASDIGIKGNGTVNGQGSDLAKLAGKEKSRRPFLIRFVRCNNVAITDVFLTRSASYCTHIFRCNKVLIEGVNILNRGVGGNDGIDLDCSENVIVRGCSVDSDDDSICLKTTSPFPCRNIDIENCKLKSAFGAIKFGTESAGDFENVTISNIDIIFARGGIKINSVDGSNIRNIDISDIRMEKVMTPIFIRLGAKLRIFREGDVKKDIGTIKDIRIRNVKANAGDMVGIHINGIPGHSIDGLIIEDIDIHVIGNGTAEDAQTKLVENIKGYPEIFMFGKVIPAYGVYMRHAKNVTMKGIKITADDKEARPVFVGIDLTNIELKRWNVNTNRSSEPLIRIESVKNLSINEFKPTAKPINYIKIDGENNSGIKLSGLKYYGL